MFSQLFKFIRLLSSDVSPLQLSSAIALAMIAGLTPVLSLHNLIVLFLVFILRVNFSAFVLAWAVFSVLAYLLDPLFNQLGEYLLLNPDLKVFWTSLYNMPLARISGFNNTLLLGSFVFSMALFIPVLILFKFLIVRYRKYIVERFKQSRLFRIMSTNKWVSRAASFAE